MASNGAKGRITGRCALEQFCTRGGIIRQGEQITPLAGPGGEPAHTLCVEAAIANLGNVATQVAPILAIAAAVVGRFGPNLRAKLASTAEGWVALRLAEAGTGTGTEADSADSADSADKAETQ